MNHHTLLLEQVHDSFSMENISKSSLRNQLNIYITKQYHFLGFRVAMPKIAQQAVWSVDGLCHQGVIRVVVCTKAAIYSVLSFLLLYNPLDTVSNSAKCKDISHSLKSHKNVFIHIVVSNILVYKCFLKWFLFYYKIYELFLSTII